jgi:acetylornithine deacetylase
MSEAPLATVEMIRRLVGFRTVSRDSNLDLIDFVREYLKGYGIESRLTFDDERRKANLFATIGPAMEGGIVLSGHTDVVPVERQPWDSDPFELVERDGRLYGRGTADMKSFLAVVLETVPELTRRDLPKPVHLSFSYDEEVGCLGVRRLIEDLKHAGVRPASCIVGEPTGMRPVIAHKGKRAWRCTVRGRTCHSAYAPLGVNAVEYAAEVVAFLRHIARTRRLHGPFDPTYDIPHSTVHTGVFRGGTAINIVPHECTFDFEFRYLPGDDPEALLAGVRAFIERELLPDMHAVDASSGFDWRELSVFPGLDTDEHASIVALAKTLCGDQQTGKVSFGTEASLFQQAGIVSVICGPGATEQVHKANEFVSLEQVARCREFMQRLVEKITSEEKTC